MALTKRQKQVLDFIAEFVDENGYCPSYEEIARGLELASLATVHKHITVLEGKSYLKRGFNLLYAAGLEPLGIQILSPREIEPDVASDLRLVDSETQETLDISSSADLLNLYQEYRQGLENDLALLCQRRSGRFLPVSAATPVESILFNELRRRGWIE